MTCGSCRRCQGTGLAPPSACAAEAPCLACAGKGAHRSVIALIQARLGSQRFPRKVLAPIHGHVQLRPASLTGLDVYLLWVWRTDPLTRRMSSHTADIPFAAHARWFAAVLADAQRQMWIAEVDRVPVGTVRVDARREGHDLSWTVAPEARGRGYGAAMVHAVAAGVPGPLRALIKRENAASQRIAHRIGLRPLDLEAPLQTWVSPSGSRPPDRGAHHVAAAQ